MKSSDNDSIAANDDTSSAESTEHRNYTQEHNIKQTEQTQTNGRHGIRVLMPLLHQFLQVPLSLLNLFVYILDTPLRLLLPPKALEDNISNAGEPDEEAVGREDLEDMGSLAGTLSSSDGEKLDIKGETAKSEKLIVSDLSKVLVALPLQYQRKVVEAATEASKPTTEPETASDQPASTSYEAEEYESVGTKVVVNAS